MIDVDPKALSQTALRLYKLKEGELVSTLVFIGERLGLFGALWAAGPSTSEEFADHRGLHERWCREWLFAMSAAGIVNHEDGVFTLPPESAVTLVEDSHPAYMAKVFGPPVSGTTIDATFEAFHTGIGIGWDAHGPDTCHFQTAMGEASQAAHTVPIVIGALDGVAAKLEAGARVLDIGCGAGVAACEVAKAYPQTTVMGLDPSATAIGVAKERANAAGITNIRFATGTFDNLPDDGSVDLLMTLDVLHDLPKPGDALRKARAAVADDGTWLVADIRSAGSYEGNAKIPVLPLMYSMSVLYCMSSAMSEPNGAGLGTLGMHPDLLQEMSSAAGFTQFTVHDHDTDPTNLHYELRP